MAGARDCAPCSSQQKREGVVAASKILAGVGHLNTIRKEAFRVAGTAQEPCSSEMLGGLGADFLREHLSVLFISGFALPSLIHNNQHLLSVPIFETSATALCGTTGRLKNLWFMMHVYAKS